MLLSSSDAPLVQITDGGETPVAGSDYTLICNVSSGSVFTVAWTMNGSVLQGQTTETLHFSPLRLSDAGQYICQVTVGEVSYADEADVILSRKEIVRYGSNFDH